MTTLQAQREISRKRKVIEHGLASKNVSKTCRYFGISRETYYEWKRALQTSGEAGLLSKKRGPKNNLARQVPLPIQEKIIHLRAKYHFGSQRIVCGTSSDTMASRSQQEGSIRPFAEMG